MPNPIIESVQKRGNELAEKSQEFINTAYHRGIDMLGIDEEDVRGRLEQVKAKRSQIESTVQSTLQEQLKELQTVQVKAVSRLEDAVGTFKEVVTANYKKLSQSLDKLETRLQEIEKTLNTRTHQLPIADYDRLNADEVVRKIEALGADKLRAVREYEAAHKGRVTVLKAIDSRLAS
jgi:chromosome segregation ATPase